MSERNRKGPPESERKEGPTVSEDVPAGGEQESVGAPSTRLDRADGAWVRAGALPVLCRAG